MGNSKPCGLIAIVAIIVLILVITVGQLVATQLITIQSQACGVLQEGLSQLNNNTQTSSPQTKAECLQLVAASAPLVRIYAAVFSSLVSVGICIFGIAALSFFSSARRLR